MAKVHKVYTKKALAMQIATKLSKKSPHSIMEAAGGWQVISDVELEALTAGAASEVTDHPVGQADQGADSPAGSHAEGDAAEGTPVSDPQPSGLPEGFEHVTMNAPVSAEGAYTFIVGGTIRAQTVITFPCGGGPKGPVERWFEKKKIISAKMVEGGVQIVAPLHEFLSRGITPDMLTKVSEAA